MPALSRSSAVNIKRDDTKRMEDEQRKMEAKLEVLRRTLDVADGSAPRAEGGRWGSGSTSKPIRSGYVKGVLEAKTAPKARAARPPSEPRLSELGGDSARAAPASRSTPRRDGPLGDILGASGGSLGEAASLGTSGGSGRGGKAASNLQAAVGGQMEDAREVENFLADLKLDRYVSIFLENGFDSMDIVQEMQESHMREVGMAAGHVLKLTKKLGEMRPEPPAPTSPSQRRVTFGGAEQAARPAVGGSATGTAAADVSDGAFNEEESAASFQEALRAWREGRSVDDSGGAAAAGNGGDGGGGAVAAPKVGGSFWSTVGGSEVNLERCSTPVRAPTEAAASETAAQHDPAPSEEKLACYQCYKQFFAHFAVERTHSPGGGQASSTKRLCSEACAEKWVKAAEDKAEQQRKRQEKMAAMKEAAHALERGELATAAENAGGA